MISVVVKFNYKNCSKTLISGGYNFFFVVFCGVLYFWVSCVNIETKIPARPYLLSKPKNTKHYKKRAKNDMAEKPLIGWFWLLVRMRIFKIKMADESVFIEGFRSIMPNLIRNN